MFSLGAPGFVRYHLILSFCFSLEQGVIFRVWARMNGHRQWMHLDKTLQHRMLQKNVHITDT